jgi:hypothetical protein
MDTRYHVRKFIRAVEPGLAMELEKNGPYTALDIVASEAKRLEHVLAKYKTHGNPTTSDAQSTSSNTSKMDGSVADTLSYIIQRLDALQVNNISTSTPPSAPVSGDMRNYPNYYQNNHGNHGNYGNYGNQNYGE